jgi:ribosomal protein S26
METVICEYCGKEVPKDEATFCEGAGFYACPDCADEYLVTCERCGDVIVRGEAYSGFDGYLCECCHDDLFG